MAAPTPPRKGSTSGTSVGCCSQNRPDQRDRSKQQIKDQSREGRAAEACRSNHLPGTTGSHENLLLTLLKVHDFWLLQESSCWRFVGTAARSQVRASES